MVEDAVAMVEERKAEGKEELAVKIMDLGKVMNAVCLA
jgi:hypothetical protein